MPPSPPSPSIMQIGQYLRDLSFENFSMEAQVPPGTMPAIEMGVDVEVRALSEPKITDGHAVGDYESGLKIRILARSAGKDGKVAAEAKPVFMIEVAYAGRYRMAEVPEGEVEPFLAIEAPRLLFPFVRQIVAEAAMHGGLPPLLIAPVDFMAVYQQQKTAK